MQSPDKLQKPEWGAIMKYVAQFSYKHVLFFPPQQHEERQLLWDQREVELERSLAKLEQQQADMVQAALRFEEATGSVPDPNLPIANQLEEAIRRIKDHVKIIIGCRHENKNLKTQVTELKRVLEESETKNMQNAKIISELRLRLPVSERQSVTEQVESLVIRPQDYGAKKALQIAQSTISSLQQMITKKEESILKYQELLKVRYVFTLTKLLNILSQRKSLRAKKQKVTALNFVCFSHAMT